MHVKKEQHSFCMVTAPETEEPERPGCRGQAAMTGYRGRALFGVVVGGEGAMQCPSRQDEKMLFCGKLVASP